MIGTIVAISLALLAGLEPSSAPPYSTPQQTPLLSSDMAKPFMPGVRINWQDREVEVDARVVLRAGMLELFACSPRTREHESIVCIDSKPSHIFQALGLLGLEPGHPPVWDHEAQRLMPASGPRLRVRVRYELNGTVRVDDIHEWMWDDKTNQPAPVIRWVFSGSRWNRNGSLAADDEGTVVSVVDFDSALISIPQSYSSRNDELWLRPNPAMIPPIGSPCVLLIKVVPAFHREVRLTRFSRILYEGKLMGRLSFARALARDVQSDPNLTLELQADQLALKVDVDTITQVVYGAGLTPERLIIVYENDAILEPLDIDGMVTLLKRQDDGPRRMFQQLLEKYEECRQALQAFRQVMENHGDELQDRLNWIFETGAKLLDVEDGTTPVAD